MYLDWILKKNNTSKRAKFLYLFICIVSRTSLCVMRYWQYTFGLKYIVKIKI